MSDDRRIRLIELYCAECDRVAIKRVQGPLELDAALHCPQGCGPCEDWHEVDRPDVLEQQQTWKYWVKCPHCAVVHADELITWHENGTDYEGIISCPECERPVGGPAGGAWGEVEVPEPPIEARPRGYSRDVSRQLSRLASRVDTLESARSQPPFQRVVNHAPEHARRIASLEEQIKEFRELLGVNVVNAVSVRLKEEKRLEERIEKVHADADKWTGNLHDVCVQLGERIKKVEALMTEWEWESCVNEVAELKKRVEKVETEGVGYKAVVTRDPELANQFAKLEKKIEPLQGWVDEVAEKIRGLNTKIDVSVMRIDALAEDHEEGVKQIRDINTRVRGLETSSVHNESPLNRITRLENGRKVLMDRVEGLKETFDGAYTNAMSKVEELEWAIEKLKKLEGWKADARVNMLESEFGEMQDSWTRIADELEELKQQATDPYEPDRLVSVLADTELWKDMAKEERDQRRHLGELEKRLLEQAERIGIAETRVAQAFSGQGTDGGKIGKLESRVDRLRQDFADRNNRSVALKGRLEELEKKKTSVPMPVLQDLRVLKERVDQLADKLPMKGAAAATGHVDAVAQEVRKLNQRVSDMWADVMGEGEGESNRTMLELIDAVSQRGNAHKALFSEHVERCRDFEVDIRKRVEGIEKRALLRVNQQAKHEADVYSQFAGVTEQLKGLRQDFADLECRAIRVGAVEEAHGALAGQFERLVTKLDQYPEITMEASAKAREVTSRVSKLETMVAEHLLARIEGDDKLTERIDGVELRVANAETISAGQRKDLDRIERLAKSADEEMFAQGAVEGICERLDKIEPGLDGLEQRMNEVVACAAKAGLAGDDGRSLNKELKELKQGLDVKWGRIRARFEKFEKELKDERTNRLEQAHSVHHGLSTRIEGVQRELSFNIESLRGAIVRPKAGEEKAPEDVKARVAELEHKLEGVNALVEDIHSSVPSAWAERVDGQGKRLTKVEDRYTELDERFKCLAEDQELLGRRWDAYVGDQEKGDDRDNGTTTAGTRLGG